MSQFYVHVKVFPISLLNLQIFASMVLRPVWGKTEFFFKWKNLSISVKCVCFVVNSNREILFQFNFSSVVIEEIAIQWTFGKSSSWEGDQENWQSPVSMYSKYLKRIIVKLPTNIKRRNLNWPQKRIYRQSFTRTWSHLRPLDFNGNSMEDLCFTFGDIVTYESLMYSDLNY